MQGAGCSRGLLEASAVGVGVRLGGGADAGSRRRTRVRTGGAGADADDGDVLLVGIRAGTRTIHGGAGHVDFL